MDGLTSYLLLGLGGLALPVLSVVGERFWNRNTNPQIVLDGQVGEFIKNIEDIDRQARKDIKLFIWAKESFKESKQTRYSLTRSVVLDPKYRSMVTKVNDRLLESAVTLYRGTIQNAKKRAEEIRSIISNIRINKAPELLTSSTTDTSANEISMLGQEAAILKTQAESSQKTIELYRERLVQSIRTTLPDLQLPDESFFGDMERDLQDYLNNFHNLDRTCDEFLEDAMRMKEELNNVITNPTTGLSIAVGDMVDKVKKMKQILPKLKSDPEHIGLTTQFNMVDQMASDSKADLTKAYSGKKTMEEKINALSFNSSSRADQTVCVNLFKEVDVLNRSVLESVGNIQNRWDKVKETFELMNNKLKNAKTTASDVDEGQTLTYDKETDDEIVIKDKISTVLQWMRNAEENVVTLFNDFCIVTLKLNFLFKFINLFPANVRSDFKAKGIINKLSEYSLDAGSGSLIQTLHNFSTARAQIEASMKINNVENARLKAESFEMYSTGSDKNAMEKILVALLRERQDSFLQYLKPRQDNLRLAKALLNDALALVPLEMVDNRILFSNSYDDRKDTIVSRLTKLSTNTDKAYVSKSIGDKLSTNIAIINEAANKLTGELNDKNTDAERVDTLFNYL